MLEWHYLSRVQDSPSEEYEKGYLGTTAQCTHGTSGGVAASKSILATHYSRCTKPYSELRHVQNL